VGQWVAETRFVSGFWQVIGWMTIHSNLAHMPSGWAEGKTKVCSKLMLSAARQRLSTYAVSAYAVSSKERQDVWYRTA